MRGVRILAAFALGAAACTAVSPDPGATAQMSIPGAQFVPGAIPGGAGGPAVIAIDNHHSTVRPGSIGERIQGALASGATAVALGLDGDEGYWIVPAGVPDVATPDEPSYDVSAAFAEALVLGPHVLRVAGADGEGRFGDAATAALTAQNAPPPDGMLVVSLDWDTDADLDLRVVDGNGVEIWARNINSYRPPPPGSPPDPTGYLTGGILDFDSNAQCAIDGRNQENVVWKAPPPSGHYLVRVDPFSMCGQPAARWSAVVRLGGQEIGSANGWFTDADTRGSHDAGAGTLALGFEVP